MLKVLTFNAAMLDVRIFGHSFYRPLDHIDARLTVLAEQLQRFSADIVFLQEVFHHDKQQVLLEQLDHYYPYVCGLARAGLKIRLDNELLILSRFPLGQGVLQRFKKAPAEELRHTSKGFYHIPADIPGLGTVNLLNFHMSAGGKHGHPQSPLMEAIRSEQIQQLVDYCRTLDCVILAGDLNAGPQISKENYQLLLDCGYHDLFSSVGAAGISWDPDNPLVRQGPDAHLPAGRIDHIFADATLLTRLQTDEAGVAFSEALVELAESRIPISDHYAISATLSIKK